MKKIVLLSMLLAAGFAQAGAIETVQYGGSTASGKDNRWDSSLTWASATDSNLVFTIAVTGTGNDPIPANNLVTYGNGTLAIDSGGVGNAGRLELGETVTVSISYVDPNGSLLALGLNAIGASFNNNTGESSTFTDAIGGSFQVVENGDEFAYPTGTLQALTKDNTDTWSLTVAADNTNTTSAFGSFELEYEVSTGALPATAENDSYVLPYGVSTLTNDAPGVLANDVGDSAVLATNVSNGTLNLSTNGGFTYTANPGFEGTDTFAYSAVKGGTDISAPAIVTLEVNLTPAANDDTYTLPLGSTNLVISAPGVLGNDVYAGTNTLFAQQLGAVTGGTLNFTTNNGSFSYDSPGPGTNSFTYLAYDMGSTSTVAATVSLITLDGAPPLGTVITQTVGNLDWNEQVWGTPTNAPSPLYDYITTTPVLDTNGNTNNILRIQADGSSGTFGGASLTLTAGIRGRMKVNSGTATVNGNVTLDGGRLNADPSSGGDLSRTPTLQSDQLIIANTGTIDVQARVNSLTLDSILTGSGDLTIEYAGGSDALGRKVIFNAISNYTGAITVRENMAVEFGQDYTFSGAMTLEKDSQLVVNSGQTLTFGEGLLTFGTNGTVVAIGSYSNTDLTNLGTNFVDNGGTLVVAAQFVNTPSTSTGFESVDADTIKWTISLPATANPAAYYPKSTDNLVISNWVGVAHSDTAVGPFAVTNLSVAGGDSTNKIIYVKSTNSVEFLRVDVE